MVEILSAEHAVAFLKPLARAEVEEFWVLALGPRKNVIARAMLFRGTVDWCMVHPRDVFRFACLRNASSLLIAHNHPSGGLEPSDLDVEITERLIQAGRFMEIPVIDHLLLAPEGYASFAANRWCHFSPV